jgi:hypothetical protein
MEEKNFMLIKGTRREGSSIHPSFQSTNIQKMWTKNWSEAINSLF